MSAMMPTGHDGQWTVVCMLCFSIPQSANFSTIIISMILARSWPQSVGNARVSSRGHVLLLIRHTIQYFHQRHTYKIKTMLMKRIGIRLFKYRCEDVALASWSTTRTSYLVWSVCLPVCFSIWCIS